MPTAATFITHMTPGVVPFAPSKIVITRNDDAVLPLQMGITNIFDINLDDDSELTFKEPVIGVYILKIKQTAGSKTITWPATVLWSRGTAPTLTTTQNKVDIITLFYDGTKFYGTYTLNF